MYGTAFCSFNRSSTSGLFMKCLCSPMCGERRVLNLRTVEFSISEQLLHINTQRFRSGLVFKAHRLLYHSTLCLRVIKKRIRPSLLVTKRSCLTVQPAPAYCVQELACPKHKRGARTEAPPTSAATAPVSQPVLKDLGFRN